MIHVLAVVGTRPEAIKMAPVIQELRRRRDRFQVRVCATAQHREMLDQMFSLFGIVPDVDLDLMQPDQTPSQVAARVLLSLEPVLREERPDWILVQGDTTTVMAAALCANHNRVRVGHVEAGLRSFDRANPFPEEMNRVVTDQVSDLLFAPTAQAQQNLLREGVPEGRIHVTGNTVIDALLQVASQPWQPPEGDPLQQLDPARRWVLVTAHRRENLGAPLLRICTALRALAERGDVQVIYPVHLNPAVWGPVHESLAGVPGVVLLPPVDYRRLVYLLKRSSLVLTDSGGIQEEAPSVGVPVLVLREVTERPEGVAAGTAQLVGTDPQWIVAAAARILDVPGHGAVPAHSATPRRTRSAVPPTLPRTQGGVPETRAVSPSRSTSFAPGLRPGQRPGVVARDERRQAAASGLDEDAVASNSGLEAVAIADPAGRSAGGAGRGVSPFLERGSTDAGLANPYGDGKAAQRVAQALEAAGPAKRANAAGCRGDGGDARRSSE